MAVDERLYLTHKEHLEDYWPILIFGTVIELLSYFLVHPDLFTLIVCIKTLVLTAVWLARRSDGTFVSFLEPSTE
jgi:hypothetical protein